MVLSLYFQHIFHLVNETQVILRLKMIDEILNEQLKDEEYICKSPAFPALGERGIFDENSMPYYFAVL